MLILCYIMSMIYINLCLNQSMFTYIYVKFSLEIFNPFHNGNPPVQPLNSLYGLVCPCLLLYTSVYSCIPLYTPVYPSIPLYTPVYPSLQTKRYVYMALYVLVYSCIPLYTPVYPSIPLYTPVYPCILLYTPVYPCLSLYTLHSKLKDKYKFIVFGIFFHPFVTQGIRIETRHKNTYLNLY